MNRQLQELLDRPDSPSWKGRRVRASHPLGGERALLETILPRGIHAQRFSYRDLQKILLPERPRIREGPYGARRVSVGNCGCSGPTGIIPRSPAPSLPHLTETGRKPSPPYSPLTPSRVREPAARVMPPEICLTIQRNFGLLVQRTHSGTERKNRNRLKPVPPKPLAAVPLFLRICRLCVQRGLPELKQNLRPFARDSGFRGRKWSGDRGEIGPGRNLSSPVRSIDAAGRSGLWSPLGAALRALSGFRERRVPQRADVPSSCYATYNGHPPCEDFAREKASWPARRFASACARGRRILAGPCRNFFKFLPWRERISARKEGQGFGNRTLSCALNMGSTSSTPPRGSAA